MKRSISNAEIGAVKCDQAARFPFGDEGKAAQVADAHLYRFEFQRVLRMVAAGRDDRTAHIPDDRHPVIDKALVCRGVILGRKRCRDTPTLGMAQNQDMADLKAQDTKLDCRRCTVKTAAMFKRRHKIGDIAQGEDLSWNSVKHRCRINAAIAARNNHQWRRLAITGQSIKACLLLGIRTRAKPVVSVNEFCKFCHIGAVPQCGGNDNVPRHCYLVSMSSQIIPEAHETNTLRVRKPDWIRVKAPTSVGFAETKALMRRLNLATVCEEAACPNIGECWTKKHATVMILGDTCTRACAFCNVKTGMPRAVDATEPQHVADAAAELGLQHIVVTSVDRDDLPDGGASQFVKVINALRSTTPNTTIEILTPDFRNKAESAVAKIIEARPDVYNHNLETVPRLYPTIRPGARYYASLRLLEGVKRHDPTIFTKSGMMMGLGEGRMEVHQVMDDMRSADVDFLTLGQYLQPTPRHTKVEEFVTPQTFDAYAAIARAKGFLLVASSPLTRSSYHADRDFAAMQAARSAKTDNAKP